MSELGKIRGLKPEMIDHAAADFLRVHQDYFTTFCIVSSSNRHAPC